MRKLASLSLKKIAVMLGGRLWLLPLVFGALCVCLAAFASAITASISTEVRIAAVDECGSELSSSLLEQLGSAPGFELTRFAERRSAEDAVMDSEAEAMLVIGPDYDEAIAAGGSARVISIFTAPGSVSAELIRETLAGKLIAQGSYVRVLNGLEAEGVTREELDAHISEFKSPRLFTVTHTNGGAAESAVFGRGFPGYEGFSAMALMLIMLTLTHALAAAEPKRISARMRSLRCGQAADFASDAVGIFALALLFAAPAFGFAPNRTLLLAAGLICYCLLLTGLSLLLVRMVSGARMDLASPFIALVTSLFGGCFADLASLSPALAAVARCTPQGQLIAAVNGAPAFTLLLAAEGMVLGTAALLLSRKKYF